MVHENTSKNNQKNTEDTTLIVLSTFPSTSSKSDLNRLITELLEKRLIACANIVPAIESLYIWQGEVQNSSELLLLLKTTQGKLKLLKETFIEKHPYDTPEFLAISPKDVNDRYSKWIASVTTDG